MAKPILLSVDDDSDVLRSIERDLRSKYGSEYRVIGSDSPEGALDLLKQLKVRNDSVALMLADQRMPRMDGVEFLQLGMRIFPKAKRALLTAYADMNAAIQGAANAIFFNQGQVCCAGSRLYIEEAVFEQVVEGVAKRAKKIKVGPGLDPQTQMGPLISDQQLRLVSEYVEAGLASGATALSGGHRYGEQGYFLEPTVLAHAKQDMQVVQEEIFGPVVVALPFKDFEEILPLANDSMYGLAAGIWTKDLSKAHALAAQLHAGTVWINCYNVFDAAMPFGGYKQSGWGREMGHEVLENYTEVKSVCIKL